VWIGQGEISIDKLFTVGKFLAADPTTHQTMPLEPLSPETFTFIAQVDEAYTSLTRQAPHLGGHLFYTGPLTEQSRPAIAAANIAGAATLSVSANQAAAKQAMHEGIVDFLVNSLDEALRILKNEIRKRETVAVCVTAAPAAIEQEMQDRGVQPDLTLAALTQRPVSEAQTWLTWRPTESPAQWLPKIDAIALASLPPEAAATRRWLERAPRYLGRQSRNLRVLHTTESIANQFIAQLSAQIAAGTIPVAVELETGHWGDSHHQSLVPGL
jgi:hypothetical protein